MGKEGIKEEGRVGAKETQEGERRMENGGRIRSGIGKNRWRKTDYETDKKIARVK